MIKDPLIFKSVAKNHKLVGLDDVVNERYFVLKGCSQHLLLSENMLCSSLESSPTQIPSI